MIQFLGQEQFPFVQEPHTVADILQFPQIVGRDHRSKIPVHDLPGEQTLHRLAHHRIEPVKRLVTQKIFCLCAQSEED